MRGSHDLIQSTLDDPGSADLAAVPIIGEVPPLPYRFSANAPAGAPDSSKWVYVLQVAEGANLLGAFAGLSGRLWVVLREKWPLEVVVEGQALPPYQAATVTVAPQIWSA